MEGFSQLLLYIGMVANLVVIMLIIIAILLIYSLLLKSIDKKKFEFGVMRVSGLSSSGLISLIGIQALLFVVPAVILGFLASVPALYFVYHKLGSNFDVKPVPSTDASLLAIGIGFLVPAVSAIIPIQTALSKNLTESITE